MDDYILLMHSDGGAADPAEWEEYISKPNRAGNFQGGSSIGEGVCFSKMGESQAVTRHLSG